MQSIYARGVSEALFLGRQALLSSGVEVQTRNGLALEFPTPVITTYTHSRERVLFYPERDANPYFHLMESLWMLAGRNDVDWISQFNGRMNTYSDDGVTFHGAYGYRWRNWFGKDQLQEVMFRLGTYHNDRRAVLGIWDPHQDLVQTNDGKDYPCNTQIYFWERNEDLNMTVTNRSNDMIWGAYGANAVHMSVLLEYMAGMLGYGVGAYYQFSNNLHAYTSVLDKLEGMQAEYEPYLTIADDGLSYTPPALIDDSDTFDEELLEWFKDEDRTEYNNSYLSTTCGEMRKSWRYWKAKNFPSAYHHANKIEDRAWRKACIEWLDRRVK
mgnify:FL=1|jgi:thymidylate synthase